MAEPLSIEHVTKVYPGGNAALRDISIEIPPGDFLVLLGPSGSGKTTLLRCLAGIEKLTSGRLCIGARVVADEALHLPPEQRDLSMVFQDYALWPHLTARDNVAFALRRRGLKRQRAREVADRMLGRVGLGALGDRFPSALSGGEQQRVALARALVGETALVLCDEPLSNLDANLRERMRIEIAALVREAGATTAYITHDQGEAFALADRVGVLEKGRLVQLGPPEEIYAHPATPFVARFTGLAAEIPVRVHARVGGSETLVEVSAETRAAVRRIVARLRGREVDRGATLLLRPTAVALTSCDGADAHLVGRVTDVAFRGRGYEHVVAVEGGIEVTGVFAGARVARDERVGLRLQADGCHVFGHANQDDEEDNLLRNRRQRINDGQAGTGGTRSQVHQRAQRHGGTGDDPESAQVGDFAGRGDRGDPRSA